MVLVDGKKTIAWYSWTAKKNRKCWSNDDGGTRGENLESKRKTGIKPKQVGLRHEKEGEKRRVRETCRDSQGGDAATQQLQGTGGGQGLLGRVEFSPWGFFKGDDAASGVRASPQNHEILICVAVSLRNRKEV